MNTKHELQDLLSLCQDDEKFAIQQALNLVSKIRSHDNDPSGPSFDELKAAYDACEGKPRSEWTHQAEMFEAYYVYGNTEFGGGCFNPGGAIPMANKDEWGIADVYTVPGAKVDDDAA